MTPACKLLKSNKIEFSIHEYNHDPDAKSFGLEAAEKLGLNVEEVFKTIIENKIDYNSLSFDELDFFSLKTAFSLIPIKRNKDVYIEKA